MGGTSRTGGNQRVPIGGWSPVKNAAALIGRLDIGLIATV